MRALGMAHIYLLHSQNYCLIKTNTIIYFKEILIVKYKLYVKN